MRVKLNLFADTLTTFTNELFHEKTNIAYKVSIRNSLSKHSAQAYPNRHFSTPLDFLFQESSPLSPRRNVSARIILPRLICVDTLRRGNYVGLLLERLKFFTYVYQAYIISVISYRSIIIIIKLHSIPDSSMIQIKYIGPAFNRH